MLNRNHPMKPVQDFTGMTFHRLTVIDPAPKSKNGMRRWHCRCVCGNETVAVGADLKRGHAKSCGCLQREAVHRTGKARKTHGLSKTIEYMEAALTTPLGRFRNWHQRVNAIGDTRKHGHS